MLRSTWALRVLALLVLWTAGCPIHTVQDAGGEYDAGGGFPPDASTPGPDASTPGPDASAPEDAGSVEADASQPDAAPAADSGAGEPDTGTCSGDACAAPDLVVAFPASDLAVSFRNATVTEDDCELFEGCVRGVGGRSLLELHFTLANIGGGALDLGQPFENPRYYASLCQDAYVIDAFFAVEVIDASGAVVMDGMVSTSCIAGDSGGFTCRAQGLAPGEGSAQPIGRCDYLDVTGLAEGSYTLRVTANPDGGLLESNYANNSAEIAFDYTACEGTVCGSECCPEGVACVADVCMLPDLRINRESAAGSLWITHQTFDENSCEMMEMCVNGSGTRRLLQFEGRIENWGPGDLNPGPEQNNPLYEFSECHGHYHFTDFTDYRLLNTDGSVAAFGHKQSFCLVDMAQVEGATVVSPPGTRPPPGETGCSYLSAGWADIYGVGTQCQWVDITDVPPGEYLLQLSVNPEGNVPEADTDNNVVQVPVQIAEDVPCEPAPEICGDAIDQDCDEMPDQWDPDCQTCFPGDPFCEDVVQVSGNASCATPYDMTEQATYESWIEADDTEGVSPGCGGAGGDVFFAFTLESEQAVFLGTFGSRVDTVLALYLGDCEGEQLRCVDDSCSGTSSQFVDVLGPGQYVVAVKAKDEGDTGPVRLKFQHADANGAIVLDAPGVYAGDTSIADDSAQACEFQVGPPPGSDAGPAPTEEECVRSAEEAAGGVATHECLHCACEIDPAGIAGCDATCWSLIDCVVENCGGDGSNVNCIVNACQNLIGGASAAQIAGPILRMCPESCPLQGGGMAGSGGVGSSMDGGVVVGPGPIPGPGPGPFPGRELRPAPDDVYLVASCQQGLTVSTCGTSAFEAVMDVRIGSLDSDSYGCTANFDLCEGDGNLGTAFSAYVPPGLTFVIVDGVDENAAGEYQMSVIY